LANEGRSALRLGKGYQPGSLVAPNGSPSGEVGVRGTLSIEESEAE
jgi:hypothetical protein